MKREKKKWIKYSFRKYSKTYPQLFAQEKKELKKVFRNAKIEHIGSTSIKGLGGKGIIDLAIFSKKSLSSIRPSLIKRGYEQWHVPKKRKFFSFERDLPDKKNPSKIFHIHLTSDEEVFMKMILFRDYLRENPKVMKEYAKLKKHASKVSKNNAEKYKKIKNPFIKSIIKKAKKENKR